MLNGSSIRLTAAGRVFAQNDSDERERLFLEHLIRFVPLVAHIRQVLDERDIMRRRGSGSSSRII